jgi:hypothetical protein
MTLISKLTTAAAMLAMLTFSAPAEAGKGATKGKAKPAKVTPTKAKAKPSKTKPKKAKPSKAKSSKAKSSKLPEAKNYDFMADDVDGERPLPNHDRILGVTATEHSSLIRLREHFLDQIIRSAEML